MKLKDVFYQIEGDFFQFNPEKNIENLTQHSQKVTPNTLFVAIKGKHFNGHTFIEKATEQGAIAVVCEELPSELKTEVSYIRVKNVAVILGKLAQNFYEKPSEKLKLIGITGTNGKTTTATLLYELFKNLGHKVGLISTIVIKINNDEYATTNTTPDALILNGYLHQMVVQGVEYCFMEVSSHGVALGRIAELHFAGGVFTNLTHDHLDFHQNFAAYRNAKKGFFDALPTGSFALINIDDKNGNFMLQNTKAKKLSYGLKNIANYKANIVENSFLGLCLKINGSEMFSSLMGTFNAYNLLAIYAVACELGIERETALQQISLLKAVQGRFEYVVSNKGVTVIVDYAHTPDALENVLNTIGEVFKQGKIITVLGCGGNRDSSKRPIMGKIAVTKSNLAVFTSDNPRDEHPLDILYQMEEGAKNKGQYVIIENRQAAIKQALSIAQKGDVVLIAGKGHETYQEIKGVKHHFDDMQEAKNTM